jgi:hypothetical protein
MLEYGATANDILGLMDRAEVVSYKVGAAALRRR